MHLRFKRCTFCTLFKVNIICWNFLVKVPKPQLDILEGELSTIDIQRGCYDLGISIVGGSDTPLVCNVVVLNCNYTI